MAQTEISRNDLFYAGKSGNALTQKVTILAAEGALLAGTVVIWGTGDKWILPDATTQVFGWGVLLEDADASSVDVTDVAIGVKGEVDEDDLLFEGTVSALTETVRAIMAMNNIFINQSSDAARVVK